MPGVGKKNANGEGTIYKRKDGRWCSAVVIGYTEAGNAKRRYAYGKSRREVAEKRTQMLAELAVGITEPAKKDLSTIKAITEEWLQDIQGRIRPITHATYTIVVNGLYHPYAR